MADTILLGVRNGGGVSHFVADISSPVYSRQLSQRALMAERGNPVLLLIVKTSGKLIAKLTHSSAGLGCWKKQMLRCNDADTGTK
jgi:hypothetical protein